MPYFNFSTDFSEFLYNWISAITVGTLQIFTSLFEYFFEED